MVARGLRGRHQRDDPVLDGRKNRWKPVIGVVKSDVLATEVSRKREVEESHRTLRRGSVGGCRIG